LAVDIYSAGADVTPVELSFHHSLCASKQPTREAYYPVVPPADITTFHCWQIGYNLNDPENKCTAQTSEQRGPTESNNMPVPLQ